MIDFLKSLFTKDEDNENYRHFDDGVDYDDESDEDPYNDEDDDENEV